MSHSPGPWRIEGVEVFDADGKHVVWELGNKNPADHALIAAATDLLAACEVFRSRMDDAEGSDGYAEELTAILAKAKGK